MLNVSVNTNPLGLPKRVKNHSSYILEQGEHYPDTEALFLRHKLSEKYAISPQSIFCGSGVDDLIRRLVLARAPKSALIIEPTYEEHANLLQEAGCQLERYFLKAEDQFILDESVLDAIKSDLDVMVLGHPNNPTGQVIEMGLLKKIHEKCQKEDVLLVIDESFIEFLPSWNAISFKTIASQSQHCIVFDGFSKTYAMAGFRLGFAISGNRELLMALGQSGQLFATSSVAQRASILALEDETYMEETYALLEHERDFLIPSLKALGAQVFPSQTNYLLINTGLENAKEQLAAEGIQVRDGSDFVGLDSRYIRIAMSTHEVNVTFLLGLKNLL